MQPGTRLLARLRFGADGVCRLLPSLVNGDEYDASRIRVRRYPIHEANGLVLIFIAADPRFEGTPEPAPDFGLGAAKPKFVIDQTFNAGMDNAVVGLMDPAHVGFVHTQWWWRPKSVGLRLKEKAFDARDPFAAIRGVREHPCQLVPQVVVSRRHARDERLALVDGQLEPFEEELLETEPTFGGELLRHGQRL